MASLDILGATDLSAPTRVRSLLPSGSALVFLGVFAVLTVSPGPLLNDPDTQWHVTIGRSIIENRALPWVDAWSHTFAGQPWIAKEWLSQLLLAGASELAGWQGVTLLTALAAATTLSLLHFMLSRTLRWSVALAMTFAALMLMAPHLVARPHVLVLPATLLWVWGMAEAADRRQAPPLLLLLAMVAWANLHASFTIGMPIAGLFALEAVAGAEPGRRFALARRWAGFLALTVLAAFATPYGYRSILITPSLLGKGEPLPYIIEWQPLPLDGLGVFTLALLLAAVAALLRNPRANLFRMAFVVGLGVMTFRYARFLDLFAILLPVVVASPIARAFEGLRAEAKTARSGHLQGAACAVLAASIVLLALQRDVRPNPKMTPEAALAEARRLGLTAGRVFNDYDFGGYLIAQGVKTYIDGRNDQIYLGGFTRELNDAAMAREDGPFLALLDKAGVSWALVRPASSEAAKLHRAHEWTSVFTDAVGEVFSRDCSDQSATYQCAKAP